MPQTPPLCSLSELFRTLALFKEESHEMRELAIKFGARVRTT